MLPQSSATESPLENQFAVHSLSGEEADLILFGVLFVQHLEAGIPPVGNPVARLSDNPS